MKTQNIALTIALACLFASSASSQTIGAFWSFQVEEDAGGGGGTFNDLVSSSTFPTGAPVFSRTGTGVQNGDYYSVNFTAFDGTAWGPGRAPLWNAQRNGGSTGNSFEITFDSTAGFDYSVRFTYRNNGTLNGGTPVNAFTSFQYNNGSGFVNVPGANLALNNNTAYGNVWSMDLSSLAAIEDAGPVTLRWSLPDFDQTAGATQLRIDNFQITGTNDETLNPPRPRYLPEGDYNVLFISIDDLKPMIGAYGNPVIHTPAMDAFSSTAMRFTNAHCQQAICTASRTAVLTGVRPDTSKVWDLEARFRNTIPDVVTLPQHFKIQGYKTHAIGKVYHGGGLANQDAANSWSDGWVGGTAQKKYHEPANAAAEDAGGSNVAATDAGVTDRNGDPVTDEHYDDGKVAAAAINKLRAYAPGYLNSGERFFLGVGFYKPHLPFNCPKAYWDLYDPSEIDLAGYNRNVVMPVGTLPFAKPFGTELNQYADIIGVPTAAQARRLIHGYMATVSYVDAQVGRVLDELTALGLAENTVVVIWGDHGFHLADHGAFWTKHSNFEQATRSPLIIRAPGMETLGAGGLECVAPVELIDIYPTLTDLCSLPPANPSNGLANEGVSLRPLLEDPAQPWTKGAFSQYQRFIQGTGIGRPGWGMGYSVRTDRYRYTEWWRTMTSNTSEQGLFTDRDVKRFDSPEFIELYDYLEDPEEAVNLATNPAYSARAAELSAALAGGNGWSQPGIRRPSFYPTIYSLWRSAHTMPGMNPAIDLAPDADPDGDGISNRWEYKMGSHPFMPNTPRIWSEIEKDGGVDYFAMFFDSVMDRADVSLTAERSSTLAPGSFGQAGLETSPVSSRASKELIRSRVPVSPAPGKDFMRLKVE